MKKITILLLIAMLFSRCGSDLETKADLNYAVQFEIQAGLNPFTIWELTIPNIPTNRLDQLTAAGVGEGEVSKIVGKVGFLSTVFAGASFDFIQEVSIEVFSDNPNDSSEILYRDQVSQNVGNSLGLNASLPDVQRHLEGERFGVIVRIRPRSSAIQNISAQLDFTLGVL